MPLVPQSAVSVAAIFPPPPSGLRGMSQPIRTVSFK